MFIVLYHLPVNSFINPDGTLFPIPEYKEYILLNEWRAKSEWLHFIVGTHDVGYATLYCVICKPGPIWVRVNPTIQLYVNAIHMLIFYQLAKKLFLLVFQMQRKCTRNKNKTL